ncbi:uncharacterized protein LOC143176446 [Nomia melanderi]|uniref:uncharacterized protein LOC143176446 n=1 Tax=Nomia melanderi TaxID=2448451 RepID=UPI003FCE3AA8
MHQGNESRKILVKRQGCNARLPTRSTAQAAGLDLYVSRETLLPGGTLMPTRVPTDLSIELPNDTYGRITGRSSANMKGIHVLDGVIDPDYRGNIDMMVVNLTGEDVFLEVGQRIGQLIVELIAYPSSLKSAAWTNCRTRNAEQRDSVVLGDNRR